jgi:hypothetical protein
VRHATEELESFLAGPEEGRHLLVRGRHGIHPPAVTQGQDEKMHFDPFSRDDRPTLAPVGLALAPRRRLESHRGLGLRFFAQQADKALDDVIAAPIAHDPELFEDRLGAVAYSRQPLEDVVPIGTEELALPFLSAIGLRFLLA